MMRSRAFAALLTGLALTSCDKNAVQNISGPPAASQIKFFNFGVGAPGVNFYANTTKVTAISSATGVESTNGTNYGGVGAGGYYAALAPGQYTVTGKIAAATDKDLTIGSANVDLVAGKRYSFYLSGIYSSSSKTAEAFVVEDPFPNAIDYSAATVRFVHAISNGNPMTLYAKSAATGNEVAVGGSVAYKSGGAFASLPAGSYDLGARYAGSTTNAISRSGVAFAAGRVYTISARGDITVTSSTATNRPFLDNTANR
ncbi:MAG: hypothetical protein MNPFHGCM_02032 [Gemmatimonadaceae bacterium]|nr:hypothetical protein [Gemmatimonadaceae bacterium]